MGTQAGRPRVILLLFFLHLLSEGGRCHPPLDRSDQASDHWGIQVLETQAEHMTPKPCQRGRVPTGPKSTLQTFRGPQVPKVKQNSGCFGKTKMDRIDSVSGLGCKGMRQP